MQTDKAAFKAYCDSLQATPPGPSYTHNFNPASSNLVYAIEWPEGLLDGVNDVLVEFEYVGNTAGLYADNVLVADDYYSGKTMRFGARRHAEKLDNATFLLELAPMLPERKIYIEDDVDMAFAKNVHASLKSVRMTPEFRFELAVE